jgi:opacity protein-like surface antigen
MFVVKSLVGAAVCATALSWSSVVAEAQPVARWALPSASASQLAAVEQVQYRGRGRGDGGYRRGGGGGGLAIGLGAAIIGGIILSEAARAEHRSNHSGDWERCAQTYRSFERSTGMYTGYDGERHTCPYLR